MGAAHWLMRRTSSVEVVANRHLVAALVSADAGVRLRFDVDRFWNSVPRLGRSSTVPDDDVDAWRDELLR